MEEKIEWLKERWYVWVIGVISLLIILVFFFGIKSSESTPVQQEDFFNTIETTETSENDEVTSSSTIYYVDIKGAVQRPGMYQVSDDMRIFDVIEKAGGFREDADQNQVNLALKVADQMVIYIPVIGEEAIANNQSIIGEVSEAKKEQESEKVNINMANISDLQQLNGIGHKKATAIIEYRETNGSFTKIEDITQVTGIGQKTFEQLKEQITVE